MLSALIGLWLGGAAMAQEGPPVEVAPVVEVRPRIQNGYTAGLARGFLASNVAFTRSRVGLEARRGTVSARVVLQHLILWQFVTETPPLDGEYARVPPLLGIVEGWGRYEGRLPAGISLDVTFGRQLVTLHRGRLISENDWLTGARPIDTLDLVLRLGTFHVRVLNFRDFSDVSALIDPGSTLVTIGGRREDPVRAYVFDMVFLVETVGTDLRLTLGPHWENRRGRFGIVLDAYFQIEDLDTTLDPRIDPDNDISAAGMASLEVGWTFGPERLFRLGGRYDIYSQRLDSAGQPGGWVAPLGDVYQYYGHMNLFQTPDDTALRGLQDLAVLAVFRPIPKLALEADAHYFWTAYEPVALGFEGDLTLGYHLTPFASIEGGYSFFLGGPGLEEVTNVRAPYGTFWGDLRVEF